MRLCPGDQPRVPLSGGRERGRAEQPSLLVEDSDVVLVGVRIDTRDDNASLIVHPSLHRPFGSGRQAGTGGHNSDEALAANRFLSSHNRPDRSPTAAKNGRPPGPTRPFNDTQAVSLKAGQIPTHAQQASSLFERTPLRTIFVVSRTTKLLLTGLRGVPVARSQTGVTQTVDAKVPA